MNERIKELIKQCSDYDHRSGMTEFDKERFAELIVRECEKVAKNPTWYGESPSNGWRNPINHVCNTMKEHFGVEE